MCMCLNIQCVFKYKVDLLGRCWPNQQVKAMSNLETSLHILYAHESGLAFPNQFVLHEKLLIIQLGTLDLDHVTWPTAEEIISVEFDRPVRIPGFTRKKYQQCVERGHDSHQSLKSCF